MASQFDFADFWELLKTENGIILACFIAGVLSLSYNDLKFPASAICCVLLFSVVISMFISALCPVDIRPHVAIALMIIAGFGFIVRLVNGEYSKAEETKPMFSLKITGTGSCQDDTNTKTYVVKKKNEK
jgi:hypothetical protein